jgi:hypothetical protein
MVGAVDVWFKFKIWTRVLLVRKQIDGYCTIPQNIISITKENPDGFSFAGSLHGCVDRTMKRP